MFSKFLNLRVASLVLGLIVGVFVVAHPVSAQVTGVSGTPRVIIYSGQNPQSSQTNYTARFQRLASGTFMRDVLGSLITSGAWGNLSIVPAGPLCNHKPRKRFAVGHVVSTRCGRPESNPDFCSLHSLTPPKSFSKPPRTPIRVHWDR